MKSNLYLKLNVYKYIFIHYMRKNGFNSIILFFIIYRQWTPMQMRCENSYFMYIHERLGIKRSNEREFGIIVFH